jgi:serine/threonine-protein kinase
MIAVPTSKPETAPRERRCHPIPEDAIQSGSHHDFTYVLVDPLTRINIAQQTPHRVEPDSTQSRARAGARRPLKVGDELGPYRLLEWLGCGAEGDVWKAVRLDRAEEFVALKVLRPCLASNPARKAQFRREAERGVGLDGPSLLKVHELNEIDGYHFMIFTYVAATALRDVIKWRHSVRRHGGIDKLHPFVTMTAEDYLGSMTRTLAKAARALASVHDHRVVHRDIKPANILMDNGCHGEVYLCDFGLGRDLEVATPEQMRDGAGTPMYMAPERLLRLTADEIKCDIYSMGVTLCEALTLKRPFQVPADLPFPALALFLAESEPLPPGALDPGFPEELETIIMKAMARDPRQRHDSSRELAGDLDRFASNWSVRCRHQALRQPLRPGAYRRRVAPKRAMAVMRHSRYSDDNKIRSEFKAGSGPDRLSDAPAD